MDFEDFGFDVELDALGVIDDDDYTQEDADSAPVRARRGDLFILGEHRLMCGDASDAGDVSVLVGNSLPRMVFTDPPYGVAIGDKNKMLGEHGRRAGITENIIGDTLSSDALYKMLLNAFTNLRSVCAPDCSYYVSSPQGGDIGLMMTTLKDAGLPVRHNLIWKKNVAAFSMGRLDYDYQHEPIFYTWTAP